MTARHWQQIAQKTADALKSGASGVIISHSTDTMGYTAAALSFMLQNLSGPVILVGAQRSSDRPSSDAALNLLSAAYLALADLGEVVVLMHGYTSDTQCVIHRGTKVRKMHTSRRDAFQSINVPPLGMVENGAVSLLQEHKPRSGTTVICREKIEERVALLSFYPGMSAEILEFVAQKHRGIVLAASGLGHLSAELIPVLKKICLSQPVVLTSQCLFGRVNLNIYSTGRELLQTGVIPGEDMLPETAFVKLMWVLGQTADPTEVRALMLKNIAGEISERREVGES
jgi:glutamyl-tRNA(Gln) amidotransferase subunit D